MHGLDYGLVVLASHKTREGREDAGGDHLQVGERPRAQRYLPQPQCPLLTLFALLLRRPPVYQGAAVRGAGRVFDVDVHRFTSRATAASGPGSLRHTRPARPTTQWSQGRSPTTQSLSSAA